MNEEHQVNGRSQKRSTSSRPHGDLVKWQGIPIRSPLLRLPVELSPLAIECFECILRYCGDLPPDPELTEVKCVYTILMVSLCSLFISASITVFQYKREDLILNFISFISLHIQSIVINI